MGQVRIDGLNASLKSALRNLKSAILVALCSLLRAVPLTLSRPGKSPASVSWIIALLPVARSSWTRFGKS